MSAHRYDVLVIGGGIAGVSIGSAVAGARSVGLLEMESTLAFHTTGRSAAVFVESLGSEVIRALTRASKPTLLDPPAEFESSPMTPLPMLTIAAPGRGQELADYHRDVLQLVPDATLVEPDGAVELNRLLRPERVELAMHEPGAMELDVHALHQGFLRALRQKGGVVHSSSRVVGARRSGGAWRVETAAGDVLEAPVVVDAAGAWADEVATEFGAARVGIQPMRRSIFTVAAPAGVDVPGLPLTADFDSAFYFKPEGGQVLCSPVEETPHGPADVRADQFEIARAIDAINEATRLAIRSVRSEWAGLRSFVGDRNPVVGYDPVVEGFFWFAGQGGYGIQISPSLARAGGALLCGSGLDADLVELGLRPEAMSASRGTLQGPLVGHG